MLNQQSTISKLRNSTEQTARSVSQVCMGKKQGRIEGGKPISEKRLKRFINQLQCVEFVWISIQTNWKKKKRIYETIRQFKQ